MSPKGPVPSTTPTNISNLEVPELDLTEKTTTETLLDGGSCLARGNSLKNRNPSAFDHRGNVIELGMVVVTKRC